MNLRSSRSLLLACLFAAACSEASDPLDGEQATPPSAPAATEPAAPEQQWAPSTEPAAEIDVDEDVVFGEPIPEEPRVTFQATEAFGAGTGPMFGAAAVGTWTVSAGRYTGAAPVGGDHGSSLVTLGVERLRANSALDLSANPPVALLADGGTARVAVGTCTNLDCEVTSGVREGQQLRRRG